MIVVLLAILKAGKAYVPIEPSDPPLRVSNIIKATGVSCVCVDEDGLSNLEWTGVPLVPVRSFRTCSGGSNDDNLMQGISPDTAAYCMFTSGSTGLPKGVLVSHQSVVNLVVDVDYVKLGLDTHILQAAPLSFDASTFEIWGALLNGGILSLLQGRASPTAISDLLGKRSVNTLWLTAALFKEVVEKHPECLRLLAQLVVGGDVLPIDAVRYVLDSIPQVDLINGYGPTEATTFACTHTFLRGDTLNPNIIGKPINGVSILILDENMMRVPPETKGEIYIGGIGLAIEYLNDPDLTKGRFLRCNSHAFPERLYRTGDFGRFKDSGQIEFLGRKDNQVKIRGYRVELGEVEAALKNCVDVNDAAAMVGGGNDAKTIIGYVVLGMGKSSTVTDLRKELMSMVPHFMVPNNFVFLPRLPMTAAGKVNRSALPQPLATRPTLRVPYLGPRNECEASVAAIWQDLLKIDRIGVDDSFFDLGGQSLLAIQATSRMDEHFGTSIGLENIFLYPTIAEIATCYVASAESSGQLPIVGHVPHAPGSSKELPLSHAQRRMWLLNQMSGESGNYNVPLAARLLGRINVGVLNLGLSELVRRHEILRARFLDHEGELAQIIAPPGQMDITVLKAEGVSELARLESADLLARREFLKPFDLVEQSPFRASLIEISNEESILLLTLHHIITDGRSNNILLDELGRLYNDYLHGEESSLSEPRLQYADFVAWQFESLSESRLASQVAYWKEELADAPGAISLPYDRRRSEEQTFQGRTVVREVPPSVVLGVLTFSRQRECTIFMTLLAAFNATLYKYSGQNDLCVGVPVGGRTRSEFDDCPGLFVNTAVIRSTAGKGITFRDLLVEVKRKCVAAYANQDIPFEKIVEDVSPRRSRRRNPLFNVMFSFQSTPETNLDLDDIDTQPYDFGDALAKFDLTLVVESGSGGLRLSLVHDPAVFENSTAERILNHFASVLENLMHVLDCQLDSLSLIPASESSIMLRDWNATDCGLADLPTHLIFEARVDAQPDALALRFEGCSVTYRELDARSNKLARYLFSRGIGKGNIVAIGIDRSVALMTVLLAVLKCGAAYSPIDLELPRARVSAMLGDLGQATLIVGGRFGEFDQEFENISVLDIETLSDAIELKSSERMSIQISPQDLAYVIYTSGSTGSPKGAMNTHGAMTNRLQWMQSAFMLVSKDVVLQKTPFSFDVSVWEFFWPLIAGATLAIARPGGHRDPTYLEGIISQEKVTTLHFVPTMLSVFLSLSTSEALSNVKRMFCSGEALSYDLLLRFKKIYPSVDLHNLYGPTEAAVDVSWWECIANDREVVSIGRPIANTSLYVLDPSLGTVGVGMVGDIYIGGFQVGLGYLNRPELTADSFVPNPFGPKGSRLYRTGDIGRFLPDGSLEYLGRDDQQVKLRGMRIEPAEIERILLSHSSIWDAAVVVQGRPDDEPELVAYIVWTRGKPQSIQALRSYLRFSLPECMVPSSYHELAALPVNANGKLDRKALSPIPVVGLKPVTSRTRNRSKSQERIAAVWEELLGHDKIQLDDNFFDVGGHSIMLPKIIAKLRAQWGSAIEFDAVFEYPTIESLARYIDQKCGVTGL